MEITKEWLKSKSACMDGYEWSLKVLDNKPMDIFKFLDLLVKDNKWPWANWVIVRVMTRPQYLKYAIFSAEQVISIYEKKYPNNYKPRKAIEAAKKVLENDTEENRAAADAAAAAYAYAAAAAAAYAAADAAAYAADADAAAAAAAYAADAAAAAYAADARKQMKMKILNYGLSILRGD